jgi:hypothetical protein
MIDCKCKRRRRPATRLTARSELRRSQIQRQVVQKGSSGP